MPQEPNATEIDWRAEFDKYIVASSERELAAFQRGARRAPRHFTKEERKAIEFLLDEAEAEGTDLNGKKIRSKYRNAQRVVCAFLRAMLDSSKGGET